MSGLRLYDQTSLIELKETHGGISELHRKLSMVKASEDLTDEEKDKNIDMINFALTGEVSIKQSVIDDIEAGKADTSDIGGLN